MITIYKDGKWVANSYGGQITGEKVPGDLDQWKTIRTDVNEALHLSYGELVQRSSTLYHTYPPLASAVNKTTAYAIGDGCAFRSYPDYRILGITPEAAKDWGKQFQLLVHYYFLLLNWYAKQPVVFRGAMITGDSLLYFVRDEAGLDLVEAGGDAIDWTKSEGEYTLGIRHDKYQRKIGIYTDVAIPFVDPTTKDQNVVQFFLKEMPRQLRGLPLAYKIISLAKNHDRHMDATVARAVLESIMVGYTNTETTDIGRQIEQQQAAANRKAGGLKKLWSNIVGSRNLATGNIYQLRTGESINFTDLKTPSNTFGVFNEWIIKLIAMATDTTPGVIMSNYPTSYSSHRGEFNDFWKMVQLKRSAYNDTVNRVVIREIAKKLILDGMISAPGFFDNPIMREAWLAGTFLGPVPGYINPLQEINAQKIAVEESFTTRADVAALHGNEWENMIDEWGRQEAIFKELSPGKQAAIIQNNMTNQDPEQGSEEDRPQDTEDEEDE